jgi:hypothetical protein
VLETQDQRFKIEGLAEATQVRLRDWVRAWSPNSSLLNEDPIAQYSTTASTDTTLKPIRKINRFSIDRTPATISRSAIPNSRLHSIRILFHNAVQNLAVRLYLRSI